MKGSITITERYFSNTSPSEASYRDSGCNSTDPRAVTALKCGINIECIKSSQSLSLWFQRLYQENKVHNSS